MEPVPITPLKRDPAWEHCVLYKSGVKAEIQCKYCNKIIKGGGIFRVKQHLAGQKGNGATCQKVHPDVQRLMQQSLMGIGSKRKKQVLADDTHDPDSVLLSTQEEGASKRDTGRQKRGEPPGSRLKKKHDVTDDISGFKSSTSELDTFRNEGGLNMAVELFTDTDTPEPEFDLLLIEEERSSKSINDRRKSGKDSGSCFADEMSNPKDSTSKLGIFSNQGGLDTEVETFPASLTFDPDLDLLPTQEEESSKNSDGGRKKRRLIRKGSASTDFNSIPDDSNTVVGLERANDKVHLAIGQFFYDIGVPLDAVNSASFQTMVDAISSQRAGVALPSYHDLRSSVLKGSVQEVRDDIDQCIEHLGNTGCSILVDEWVSERGRTLINFVVYSSGRTVFLRSADITNMVNSVDAMFELLTAVVVEVGERNVLQVITNNDERYVVAGKRLSDTFPSVFWTPCAACCIDLILQDFGKVKWISTILEQCRFISRFIYNHSIVLNMMRRYTNGLDLVDIGFCSSVTDFASLKRMVNFKHNLQSMVTSAEWMEWRYSKTAEGIKVLDCISNQSFWSTCTLVTRLTDPLLRLVRIVRSERRPSMGYVFAGMYRVKEIIKRELFKKNHLPYWNIIDQRWEHLQRHPLHVAGFYLNPKFFYSIKGDLHPHVRSSVYDCVEKLVTDHEIQDKIVKETTSYHNGVGDFGRNMAVRAREKLLPGEILL